LISAKRPLKQLGDVAQSNCCAALTRLDAPQKTNSIAKGILTCWLYKALVIKQFGIDDSRDTEADTFGLS
jgi:hypothetical protein